MMKHMLSMQDIRKRLGVSTQTMERWLLAGQFPAPAEHPGRHKRAGRKWTEEQLHRFERKRDALAALGAKPADGFTTRFFEAMYRVLQNRGSLSLREIGLSVRLQLVVSPRLGAPMVVLEDSGHLAVGAIVPADGFAVTINGQYQPLPDRRCVYFVEAQNAGGIKQLVGQLKKQGEPE